jgi:hypothetical protein
MKTQSFEERNRKVLKRVGYFNIKKKVESDKAKEKVDNFYRSLYGINKSGAK